MNQDIENTNPDHLRFTPSASGTGSQDNAGDKIDLLIENIGKVVKGHRQQIIQIITCLIAKGHILLEDNPGSGKTAMAKTLAYSLSGEHGHSDFKRIQFTPDLLPMDLIGTHLYDEGNKDFIFKKGPLFSNILLADEINRASPKVQSALLECMAENQISIGDQTYKLQDLFFVIATQNPIEMEGTYPLPNAQLDRFFMKINFGYVTKEIELEIYKKQLEIQRSQETVEAVLNMKDVLMLRSKAEEVHVDDEIIVSINNIVRQTREHSGIILGASVRAGIILLKCLRAYAVIHKRNYVIEDDLAALVRPVLQHRLLFKNLGAETNAIHSIVKSEIDRLSRLNLKK
ncbi:MAG: MoxR family ATPase [Psychroserpens sp.]|nr:MoxR family ATPase [Psychroserpens sp.]